jgi:hypothetical protein
MTYSSLLYFGSTICRIFLIHLCMALPLQSFSAEYRGYVSPPHTATGSSKGKIVSLLEDPFNGRGVPNEIGRQMLWQNTSGDLDFLKWRGTVAPEAANAMVTEPAKPQVRVKPHYPFGKQEMKILPSLYLLQKKERG